MHAQLLRLFVTKQAAGYDVFTMCSYLMCTKRELSVVLKQGNARLFRCYVGTLARGIGKRFVAGDELHDIDD